ncbi:MAG: hypothetical protein JXR25_07065 [Pontiellaceae bacterium]|nr:hypothetical protein [Pontiellaceae bacterium]MBN2784571.1 hypothetical protein [Pontiellaceae bacterium]
MNIETMVVPMAENGRFDALMYDLNYLGPVKPTGDFLRQAVVCDDEWVAILTSALLESYGTAMCPKRETNVNLQQEMTIWNGYQEP